MTNELKEKIIDKVFQSVIEDIEKRYKVSDTLSDILIDSLSVHLSDALDQALEAERERVLEVIEGMKITEKKGIAEMIFGDNRKEKIRMHTNMDVGYNQALSQVQEFINKTIEEV